MPELAVFRGYIAVFGVKNGDIGNHGFSKLKVSSTLKYLLPLGQDAKIFLCLLNKSLSTHSYEGGRLKGDVKGDVGSNEGGRWF